VLTFALLKIGITLAHFMALGTMPDASDRFTTWVKGMDI